MPHTIVFDTNYLRSFGDSDYRVGKLPQKLHAQIELAFARGDMVALPNTVKLETNAWLAGQIKITWESLESAHKLLQDAGFKVLPATVEKTPDVDISLIFQERFPNVQLLNPSIEDFKEAERRTSYRLPPLPKKKPDGEEFRDRLIWCQLISYARASKLPILIVSADGIFQNGAESEEGKSARIEVAESQSDLDQRLNLRPEHIQSVVNQLLMFSADLLKQGIVLKPDSIIGIEELRKVHEPNGSLIQKFMLRTTESPDFPSLVPVTMMALGDVPISLNLTFKEKVLQVVRQPTPQEIEQLTLTRMRGVTDMEQMRNELKALMRS